MDNAVLCIPLLHVIPLNERHTTRVGMSWSLRVVPKTKQNKQSFFCFQDNAYLVRNHVKVIRIIVANHSFTRA